MCHSATSSRVGWCPGPPVPRGEPPPPCPKGPFTDVCHCETNRQAHGHDDDTDGGCDVIISDLLPFTCVIYSVEGSVASGDRTLKVCQSAMHCYYWTYLRVSCASMSNVISFDNVILCFKEEAEKISLDARVWAHRGCNKRLPTNKELDAVDAERVVVSVRDASAISPQLHKKATQIRSITAC